MKLLKLLNTLIEHIKTRYEHYKNNVARIDTQSIDFNFNEYGMDACSYGFISNYNQPWTTNNRAINTPVINNNLNSNVNEVTEHSTAKQKTINDANFPLQKRYSYFPSTKLSHRLKDQNK